jgi:hypothetical protein
MRPPITLPDVTIAMGNDGRWHVSTWAHTKLGTVLPLSASTATVTLSWHADKQPAWENEWTHGSYSVIGVDLMRGAVQSLLDRVNALRLPSEDLAPADNAAELHGAAQVPAGDASGTLSGQQEGKAEPLGYAFAHGLCQKLDAHLGSLSAQLAGGTATPELVARHVRKSIKGMRTLIDRIEFHTGCNAQEAPTDA